MTTTICAGIVVVLLLALAAGLALCVIFPPTNGTRSCAMCGGRDHHAKDCPWTKGGRRG